MIILKNLIQNFFYIFKAHINHSTNPNKIEKFINLFKSMQKNVDLIRIGGPNDGGYLVPKYIDDVKYCFSPGVGSSIEFEKDLYDKFKIKSFLADASINFTQFNTADYSEKIFFDSKYISSKNTNDSLTLKNWVNKKLKVNSQKNLLLQMDIERSEIDVFIESDLDFLKNFKVMIVEFHNFEQILSNFGFHVYESLFQKLSELFYIVHIHPNNCCGIAKYNKIKIPRVIEITFLRKSDLIIQKNKKLLIPHPLDSDCDKNKKSLKLPKIWY